MTEDKAKPPSSAFEPKIIAYCCHFCAYTAADLAGSTRMQYSPNIRVIRVPCSGKIDVIHLLRAFEEGADGVYVAGCLEGDCHFIAGNFRAKKRVVYAKEILRSAGIEPERLEMYNMSAAMAATFAETADKFTEQIRKLGPLFGGKAKVAQAAEAVRQPPTRPASLKA
jgi:coenzyme F420-reducing hydrogenase delta subunit